MKQHFPRISHTLELCKQLESRLIQLYGYVIVYLSHCCLHLCLCSDRAGSISTLDSLDFARYSDDGNRESDERVAGKMNHTVWAENERIQLTLGR